MQDGLSRCHQIVDFEHSGIDAALLGKHCRVATVNYTHSQHHSHCKAAGSKGMVGIGQSSMWTVCLFIKRNAVLSRTLQSLRHAVQAK